MEFEACWHLSDTKCTSCGTMTKNLMDNFAFSCFSPFYFINNKKPYIRLTGLYK